ncbi:hypothetical protein JAAARDRAFT_44764 [Jaapia argillacea MUCL 33604]|uniref:DRBM domain-containing protein n=1 Tax=Jaapia argillacea MUCL 33604 TaxID=933084 RepID=A0A067Q5U8_9AGAM|nr:hypothetical protein JAAARDRAFT_44764 [Jaapia argillacea MUCL 33604]
MSSQTNQPNQPTQLDEANQPRPPSNRTALNNYLQLSNEIAHLTYDDEKKGPENDCTWTSKVLFKDIEYGQATASTKKVAREEAAGIALAAIQTERAERAAKAEAEAQEGGD